MDFARTVVFLLLLGYASSGYTQNHVVTFSLPLPVEKTEGSLYNKLRFHDARADAAYMGTLQTGIPGKQADVIPETAFDTRFLQLMDALTDAAAGNGTLLFQLRGIRFFDVAGNGNMRNGYCRIKATLYAQRGEMFCRLATLDTLVFTKASNDVSKWIMHEAGVVLIRFVSGNVQQAPNTEVCYTLDDVQHIDETEKRQLPLYVADSLRDGVYYSYHSFKQQIPDEPAIIVFLKNERPVSVRAFHDKGNKKLNRKDIYALVWKGRPYIATDINYYPLRKKNMDFHFIGKTKATQNSDPVVAATMFGLMGTMLVAASTDPDTIYEMKIDHRDGRFIAVRKASHREL